MKQTKIIMMLTMVIWKTLEDQKMKMNIIIEIGINI